MSIEIDRKRRFETVAAEVSDPVQRYLRRRATADDADDAYSETLLTIWRRLDDVPPNAALPWAYGIARKVLANQHRATRRRLRLIDRVGTSAPERPILGPGEADDFPEVREALSRLSEADQEVLTLWAWEELEPREIAAVLDTTPNAVSLRLTRAKTKLAHELERQSGTDAGHEPIETKEDHQS
ncbi:MAG: sigma-70 family RNA polymerase sigma factor [Acidimicrobiia bacterium]|nr:sigma-70 family RNA polymerase sigma factor [Acidimicrobiia bacterium]